MLRLPQVSLSSPLTFARVYSDISYFFGSLLYWSRYLHLPSYLSSTLFPLLFIAFYPFLLSPPLSSSSPPKKKPAFSLRMLFFLPCLHPSPPSLHAACSHWWPLLRPGHKPAPRGFAVGVGSDGVHWKQRQADLCYLLRLQWTQCGLLGHQEWAAEEGESSNTLTDIVEEDKLDLYFHTEHRYKRIACFFSQRSANSKQMRQEPRDDK